MIVGLASSAFGDSISGGTLDNDDLVSGTQVEAGGVLSDGPGSYASGGYSGPVDEYTVVSSGGELFDAGYAEFDDIQSGGVLSLTGVGATGATTIETGGLVAIGDVLHPVTYDLSPSRVDGSIFASGSVLSFAAVDFDADYTDTGIISASDALVGSNSFSDTALEIGNAIVESGVMLTLGGSALVGSALISSGGELFMSSYDASVSGEIGRAHV